MSPSPLSDGNLTQVDGLEGAQWIYGYTADNRIQTVTDPAGHPIVDNRYDALGRVDQQIAPRETGTATYKLHYTDITAAEEDPLTNRTTYTFDPQGRTVVVEDALGHTSRTRHDGQGQAVWVQDARGNATELSYDNFNNLETVTNALDEVTTLQYDSEHRLWKTIDSFGVDSFGVRVRIVGLNAAWSQNAPMPSPAQFFYPMRPGR